MDENTTFETTPQKFSFGAWLTQCTMDENTTFETTPQKFSFCGNMNENTNYGTKT
jgi:hypothetical protein